MWTIAPPDGATHALAVAAYLAAVLGFLLLQEIGLRLRDEEHRAWWAGTGRDIVNAAGLVAIAGALRLLGLRWPAALLVGGTLTLAMFGASVLVATQLATAHRQRWAFALGLAFALPALVFLDRVVAAFALLVGALFPESAPPPRPLG